MTNIPSAKRGFTLVEMLVVIAIISIVATASVSAIKGAQRQARAAKCQSNMHSLYRAVMAFRADHSVYPPASAYELYDTRSGVYLQYRGWVNWVLSSTRSRRNDSGNLYSRISGVSEVAGDKTKASSYSYVGTGGSAEDLKGTGANVPSRIYRSIDEGAIFVYADKNFSIYCCDEFKNKYGKNCMRSYAMNQLFGCSRLRHYPLCYDTPGLANRMAMFVEMGNAGSKKGYSSDMGSLVGTSGKGTAGDEKAPTATFGDDSVWDWDKSKAKGGDGNSGENIGVMHRKSGKLFGHVIFADGHLESLELPSASAKQKEQRYNLGSGSYGN